MARYICKVEYKGTPYYFEWSTVVDAPVSDALPLKEFKKFYREEYGKNGMSELKDRLKRVEKNGTSSKIRTTFDDIVSCNRSGENETQLSKEQLIEMICNKEKR